MPTTGATRSIGNARFDEENFDRSKIRIGVCGLISGSTLGADFICSFAPRSLGPIFTAAPQRTPGTIRAVLKGLIFNLGPWMKRNLRQNINEPFGRFVIV